MIDKCQLFWEKISCFFDNNGKINYFWSMNGNRKLKKNNKSFSQWKKRHTSSFLQCIIHGNFFMTRLTNNNNIKEIQELMRYSFYISTFMLNINMMMEYMKCKNKKPFPSIDDCMQTMLS